MQEGVVYQKSAAGAQALAARDPHLTPKLRSLLILVDGKRGTPDLAKLTTPGEVKQLLARLLALGMIEAAPTAVRRPAATSAPAPIAAQQRRATAPLVEAKRLAVRLLTDMLGPTADDLCLRIEAARTPGDFFEVVERVERILQDVKGREGAAAFIAELQQFRPA